MNCKKCDKALDETWGFCPSCGNKKPITLTYDFPYDSNTYDVEGGKNTQSSDIKRLEKKIEKNRKMNDLTRRIAIDAIVEIYRIIKGKGSKKSFDKLFQDYLKDELD